jgi:hypothetical protein
MEMLRLVHSLIFESRLREREKVRRELKLASSRR